MFFFMVLEVQFQCEMDAAYSRRDDQTRISQETFSVLCPEWILKVEEKTQ